MVMEVLKKVVVTEADEIPKWIVPDSKHFGWIQGKYYPWPGNKVPSCFLTKRKKVPAPGVSESNEFFVINFVFSSSTNFERKDCNGGNENTVDYLERIWFVFRLLKYFR
jgi:hypothetical protein